VGLLWRRVELGAGDLGVDQLQLELPLELVALAPLDAGPAGPDVSTMGTEDDAPPALRGEGLREALAEARRRELARLGYRALVERVEALAGERRGERETERREALELEEREARRLLLATTEHAAAVATWRARVDRRRGGSGEPPPRAA